MRYTTFRTLAITGGIVVVAGVLALLWPSRRSATPVATPTRVALPAENGAVRQVDRLILQYLATHPTPTDKAKDVLPHERVKVNLYRDGTAPYWSRLKIDLNRNDRDDEKWTLRDGKPWKRQVSTQDNEHYDQEYLWHNDHWEPAK